MHLIASAFKHWSGGVRLYIGLAIGLLTLEVVWWARAVYGTSGVSGIRMQEAYAWLSVLFLVLALLIGPLLRLVPRFPAPQLLRDARRLLGIGAAWFGLLHATITYLVQFEAPNPLTLADTYQRSFLLGFIALLVLLAMAFTSFNAAFRKMGIWWYRLHRLVYVAALLALLHAFLIGTHAATSLPVLVGVSAAAVIILLLQAVAMLRTSGQGPTNLQVVTVTLTAFLLVAVINVGASSYLGYNFFVDGAGAHGHEAD